MTKRGLLITGVALLALIVFAYGKWFSPAANVQRAADRFLEAATRGDLAAVASMVAPDAVVSAAQWVDRVKGMTQGGTSLVERAPENPCGIEMMAVSVLRLPDGTPQGVTLLFKLAEGQWRVYQSDGKWCSADGA